MQFKVPQFLEIEDKIFGPFTFRQFVYLAGGAGLCFVLFRVLGFWIGSLPIAGVAAFSLALAFYRPNDKPFIEMVAAGFSYFAKDKLYIWERRKGEKKSSTTDISNADEQREKLEKGNKLSGSKLRDLAWSLDVLDLTNTKPK